MWLFGAHDGNVMNYACSERIYACQIFEGATLIRNYVPAVNAAGDAGLFDLVSTNFIQAAAGRLLTQYLEVLPPGYTALEYVESDGSQFLDTGVFPDARTRVICDCKFQSTTSPQRCGTTAGVHAFMWGLESAYSGRFGSIVSSTSWKDREDTGIAGGLDRHQFDLQSGSQKFDGKQYGTHLLSGNVGLAIRLFAANEGYATGSYACSMRLYRFVAYDGEMPLRDFRPARDPSGTVGLYDRVTDRFFAPVGTLAAGPAITSTTSQDVLTVTASPSLWGTPTPGYGQLKGLTAGAALDCSVESVVTNAERTLVATCVGCIVTTGGVVILEKTFEPGETPQVSYVHPNGAQGAVLKWLWRSTPLLPPGMTLLQYAEFPTGAFVETGFALEDQELRLSYETTNYENGTSVIGQNKDNLVLHWSEESDKYYWGLSGEQANSGSVAWSAGRHEVVIDRTGDHAVVLDGVVLGSGKPVTSAYRGIRLGRRVKDAIFQGRIYGLDVLDHVSGELVLSLKPAMDGSGVVGFYDAVSGRFVTSAAVPLQHVAAPFAVIANAPSLLDGRGALSQEGTVALSAGETISVNAVRRRVYDRATHTPYVLTGWTLVADRADGSRDVRTSGADEIGTCTFDADEDERYRLIWNWEIGEPMGIGVILR